MAEKELPHLVIIDGLSFLFRAYHAVRPLTRSDGLPTNALYGFAQMLIKVVRDLKPDYCVVALDSIKPTFRKEMYPEYKAHRSEMDEAMQQQMPYFEPMIAAFDIPGIRVEGVEADDVIATLVASHAADHRITIVSSDKDLMQLIQPNVVMLDTMKSRRIGVPEVAEKFGVGPDRVIHVQALIGDSSDNIPGVPGVGPKTAAKLIGEFDTLDGVYENLEALKSDKLRVSLQENRENADISFKLVTLKQDVKLPDSQVSKDSLRSAPSLLKAQDFLRNMEFNSLAGRLADAKNGFHTSDTSARTGTAAEERPESSGSKAAVEKAKNKYSCVTTEAELKEWVERCEKAGTFAIDTETTSLNAMRAELVGVSLAVAPGEACYIPLTYNPQLDLASSQENVEILSKSVVFEHLTPLLSKSSLTKVGHNIKYDLLVLKNVGLEVVGLADSMIQSFVLNGGRHGNGMDELAERYLSYTCTTYKEVCGTGKNQLSFEEVPLDIATGYAAEDADITLQLHTLFTKKISENKRLEKLYQEVEMPLVPVLVAMEYAGVRVDQTALQKLSTEFGKQIGTLEKEVYALCGEEFNLNSPKQMAAVLFDNMGLKVRGKTPKSTNVAVLEKLAEDEDQPLGQELARKILEYRQLAKLRSTYSEALQAQINPKTGRVHTSYNQTGAATGRFSSSDPNLQNIPIRTENGRRIRHAFVAQPGWQLLAADYSQIELRLLAHFSQNPALTKAFNDGVDIHSFTASQVFGVAQAGVTSEQRRVAKIINFGLIYGMGPVALSRNLGIARQEAKTFIDRYFERFSGLKDYLEHCKEFAAEHGYVETLLGRRVHIPEINSNQPMLRAGAERAAMNAPLQGSNADIIKKTMPEVAAALRDAGLKARILLQVHDELVLEVPTEELDQVTDLVKEKMSTTVKLRVPLLVGADHADNWEDAH